MDEKKLINQHWAYISSLLRVHKIKEDELDASGSYYRMGFEGGLAGKRIVMSKHLPRAMKFHYDTAFTHGEKHKAQGG